MYSTIVNIQSYLPTQTWDHSNPACQPSTVDVTTWITEADREIDSKLAGLYATPITGAESLAIVQSISARIVAIRILGLLYAGQSISLSDDLKQARKDLDAYAAGSYTLPDAPSLGGITAAAPGPPVMTMRDLREDPLQSEPVDPIFYQGRVW
jgi:hypothetical protein